MKLKNKKTLFILIITLLILLCILGIVLIKPNIDRTQIAAQETIWETSEAGTYIQTDTINLTLRGVDANGIKTYDLKTSDITVLLDGKEVSPTTKNISSGTKKDNGVEYTLTLSGFGSDTGNLSLKIAAGNLTDNSNRSNVQSYLSTGITITNSDGSINSNGLKADLLYSNPNGLYKTSWNPVLDESFKSSLSEKTVLATVDLKSDDYNVLIADLEYYDSNSKEIVRKRELIYSKTGIKNGSIEITNNHYIGIGSDLIVGTVNTTETWLSTSTGDHNVWYNLNLKSNGDIEATVSYYTTLGKIESVNSYSGNNYSRYR